MNKNEVIVQLKKVNDFEDILKDFLENAPNDNDLEKYGYDDYIDVYAEMKNLYDALRGAQRI